MTAILGISAFYHDSAAALVIDGEIVAAAQEERFTRKKHDSAFPANAVQYCLAEAGISAEAVDYVGFYEKPLLKFERLLETYLAFAPAGFSSFLKALPLWVNQKLHLRRELRRGLGNSYQRGFIFTEHHEAHAASAFFPSPFPEAAILTMDAVGEWDTTSFGIGKGNRFELDHCIRFPHSLGLLYSAFTFFCGFKVNSGEYKLMGLAPYGSPRYRDVILNDLLDLKADGSFRLDLQYFDYCAGLRMTSPAFNNLFDGPPRKPESRISQREMDLAASIQSVTEEIMLRTARHLHEQTGMKNLCLAGGVALNCVGNGRILREGPFEQIWVQPAAGDAGGALGVALLIWFQLLEKDRKPQHEDAQKGSLLGPSFAENGIRATLDERKAVYRHFTDDGELCAFVAGLLAKQNVVGWFQGRMEFGPRALGSRSILGDPRNPNMQSDMNVKIKFRESFRPFAPAVLRERASDFFEMDEESPYMMLVAAVKDSQRIETENPTTHQGFDLLKHPRSTIPAVTHVDYSARVQTVDAERHGRFYRLLKAFEAATGSPILINTSFNVRGEPIVCTPDDAYRCFMATKLDALVLEDFVLLKKEQTNSAPLGTDEYLARLDLD
jgi:carbamoyltransferase